MIMSLSALMLLAAAPPPPASAVPPVSAPLLIDQGRADRAPVPPADAGHEPDRATTRVDARASGIAIRRIDFGGARVPAPVAAAAERFVGKRATRETLSALAQAMSAAYATTDVALYTLVVPRTQHADGTITVIAVEGFVEQVRFRGGMSPLLKAQAARLTLEHPLTRSTFERMLSLMRDVPGRTLDVQVLQGTRPGGVILSIDAKRKRKDLTLTFDNRGTSLLGQGQARLDAHAYSLLRDGDRTDLTGLVSPDLRRLRYVALAHATPLGSDGATIGGSLGYISTRPRRSIVRGEAVTFAVNGVLPLIRGYRRNLTLTLGLDGVNSDAAVLGSVISSDHTRALRLAAGYSVATAKSVLTVGATASRGLDVLGARTMIGFTDTTYTKLNGRVTFDRAIGKRLVARMRVAGQWTPDRLAASERFAIGGADFGRAFDQALITGDKGYAAAGELALRPKLAGKLAGSELYGFADAARITIAARYPYLKGSFDLASAGGGVRLAYGPRASLEIEAARVIDRPYPAFRDRWRINLGWRLALAKH